jgi:uroporphyrinogen decarboxylase
MGRIISELGDRVPVIVFSKGTHGDWETLAGLGAQVIGVDWTVGLGQVRKQLPPEVGLQGNLDPFLLTTTPQAVETETRRILLEMQGHQGYIFNLGHGVPPAAKLENIEKLVDTVREIA